MQLALWLPLLAPLFLVLVPRALEQLRMQMSISGTYDVLLVPLALPRDEVLDLLRAAPINGLQLQPPPSSSHGDSGADDTHPVLLQLGYQLATGPGPGWLPKPSFSEAKLEVPFVSHPASPPSSSSGPFSYKHTILMSNRLLALASQHTAGLKTHHADFTPASSPAIFPRDAPTIAYRAGGYINAQATRRQKGKAEDEDNKSKDLGWPATREMVEMQWFGQGTGDVVTRFDFDFDKADIAPQPYLVDIELDLGLFKGQASGTTIKLPSQPGWRVKAKLRSSAAKVS